MIESLYCIAVDINMDLSGKWDSVKKDSNINGEYSIMKPTKYSLKEPCMHI
jgi:hypothetical protein